MDIWTLDVETMFSTEYSLTRLDPPSYILDERFEAICLGAARNLDKPFIVDGPDIPRFLHEEVGPAAAVVSHNQLFDACVFSWRFGFVPRLIIDTLALARTLLAHKLKSLSLRSVSQHLRLPEKGGFLAAAKGMGRADLIANGMWPEYTAYCLNDVELCRYIYMELAPLLTDEEFIIHDMVMRCAIEPRFRLNLDILAEHLQQVRTEKEELFARAMFAGIDRKEQLMSNPQFAELLKDLGVDPPTKISTTTGNLTWAFARTDVEFLELKEHPDPRVQAVVAARIGHKSTLEETRTERMLNIGRLDFPHHGTGVMPIPLKIGAAHTHRLGGDWMLNCQNWGRQSPIRRAVEAPEGYIVVASDAAQIEARFNAWFCGQHDVVEQFRQGLDVYALFATTVFGYPVNKREHPMERFVGKTGILQLGYQSGWEKFKRTVFILSGKELETPIELTDEVAMNTVTTYRTDKAMISQMWQTLATMIAWMANANPDQTHQMGPITFHDRYLVGPNGLRLEYYNLGYHQIHRRWTYTYQERVFDIYGGKMLENIVQFLARIATMQAGVRVKKRISNYDAHFVHQAHDELVFLVSIDHAPYVAEILAEEMSRTPDWAPGLPLKGEAKMGWSYGAMEEVK